MNRAYEPDLISSAKQIAKDLGMQDIIREGVYTALGGPNFETVAELKLLRLLGIDAVG
jgi:purine-nucleoside phosphorylase